MSTRTRPFKITFGSSNRKVGMVTSCSTPEGVVRSATFRLFCHRAETAHVILDGTLFAIFYVKDNSVTMEVL
jgi:hypothetical protein